MARRLVLIRHAQPAPAYAGCYLGRSDVPLGDAGHAQARALATPLRTTAPARRLCSPSERARRTADLALNPGAYQVDPDLREVDFGDWEGKTFAQIAADHPQAVARWAEFAPDFAFPGGEALAAFLSRIARVAQCLAADPAESILAFTHGGVIRMLICHFLGFDPRHYLLFRVDYASITTIDLFDGKGVLAGLNDRHHLEGL